MQIDNKNFNDDRMRNILQAAGKDPDKSSGAELLKQRREQSVDKLGELHDRLNPQDTVAISSRAREQFKEAQELRNDLTFSGDNPFEKAANGGAAQGAQGGQSPQQGAGDDIKKLLEEAQKRLEEAQKRLNEASAEMKSAETEEARQAAQVKLEAAQAEVAAAQSEIQELNTRLAEAANGANA